MEFVCDDVFMVRLQYHGDLYALLLSYYSGSLSRMVEKFRPLSGFNDRWEAVEL